MFRIGQGYDLHRLQSLEGKHQGQGQTKKLKGLVLGGLSIASPYVCIAHSDGDVLCHAIIDALLGALCLGDIGAHFPPNEEKWRGANSRELLQMVYQNEILTRNWCLVNLDVSIILEPIRLRLLVDDIRELLAETLASDLDCISIKAKTKEGVDAVGRSEAIEVYCSLLLGRGKFRAFKA